MEYELIKDDNGEIESCDCCGCEVPTALFDKPMHLISEAGRKRTVSDPKLREDQFRYCYVCSATFISSAHNYPKQHYEDGQILVCMAQCTNMILEAIRAASLTSNAGK